nr:high mobility group B protein 6-like isoform X2 [Ipomoea batatas]
MAGISSSQCMLEEFMETVTIQENRYSTSRTPCQKYLLSILQSLAKQLSRDGLEYPFTSEVEIAAKNKEQYVQEMEVYRQMEEEGTASHKKEEEEMIKLKKQEAMQLLKKIEKTENLIKKKENQRKKQKEEKNVDPNRPKKPASSFLLFSNEERKKIVEEKPGTNNATVNALISLKRKV